MNRPNLRVLHDDLNGLLKETEDTASNCKNGAPKGSDDDEDEEYDNAFEKLRLTMLASVKVRHQKHEIALVLRLLTNAVNAIGNTKVRYRTLLAMHLFKNASGSLKDAEVESAKRSLFEGPFNESALRLIIDLISRLRSIVGMKLFHEISATCWNAVIGHPERLCDPPVTAPTSDRKPAGKPSLDRETTDHLQAMEERIGVTAMWDEMENTESRFEYTPAEVLWLNAEMEADTEPDTSAPQDMGEIPFDVAECSSSNGLLTLHELVSTIEMSVSEPELVIKNLLEMLVSTKGREALEGEMFDLLGFEHFDLVGRILERRVYLQGEIDAARKERTGIGAYAPQKFVQLKRTGPAYGQSIVVQTKSEAEMRKEIKREQKKAQREINRINNAFGESERLEMELATKDFLRKRQLELNAQRWQPGLVASVPITKEVYPYVFDAGSSNMTRILTFSNARYALPEGTEVSQRENYKAITVPPVDQGSVQDIRHVYINELDELGQLGFQGFEKLNKIQSLVFEQAYKTRENLLICAPTGAGKTNIAMLTILNTIHEHRLPDGRINKDDFKIIYICPMKALATEMTESFGKRLAPLGLKVRELTGDTQLSKREIDETQMLILTPEKWDVVTRKTGDNALAELVRLLIIDEVHLLHDERGPVIETIVARTLRQVEMTQRGIRIVGLSATLPNYVDVADFLRVNPYKGLFFFDGRFRPVPLTQRFIGVKKQPGMKFRELTTVVDDICYDEVVKFVRHGHQVLVFVHSRNATSRLAKYFQSYAAKKGDTDLFVPSTKGTASYVQMQKKLKTARGELPSAFERGFGFHHAGMIRHDRLTVEKAFAQGHISVLFCTATLAWGVNLPAHAVIIRGTDVFNAETGKFGRLGVLDVQQIFGRAGRPQFENEGHGVLLTWDGLDLEFYIQMLTRQNPIESKFFQKIHDNLNAEIALGTVSTIKEAVEWLGYSYYVVRARKNPVEYGMQHNILKMDPLLEDELTRRLTVVASELEKYQMIRFDSLNGFVSPTDLGRIASQFYVTYNTVEIIHGGRDKRDAQLQHYMNDDQILAVISEADEFKQIQPREDEMEALEQLQSVACMLPIRGGYTIATVNGKVNCLIQSIISRSVPTDNFALWNEQMYIEQNAGRLSRAFFEISLRRGWAQATSALLTMSKCIEKKLWPNQNPLRQLPDFVRTDWVEKIERKRLNEGELYALEPNEITNMFRVDGQKVYDALRLLPKVEVEATLKPITYTIMQVEAVVTPLFYWEDRVLGKGGSQGFWVMLENLTENAIIYHERLAITKKKVLSREVQRVIFTIPIRDHQVKQTFQLRVASDFWLVEDTVVPLSLHNCTLPQSCAAHTDLLPLDPLPVTTLHNDKFQSIYKFDFFNPIQTQVFFPLYHTDESVLLGAPTGSGKTCCAELAIFRLLNAHPGKKAVYIAPLKALVRERVQDWKEKFEHKMGYKVIELSGDVTPDVATLNESPIMIATPEKWDGVTRSWATREYVRDVGLVIIDEIHLLGVERGAVLEAIVTRLKLLTRRSCVRAFPARLVGLSTALANAVDVGAWLGVKDSGLFNFRPSVRPVPINVHIAGFPGPHYCPRMATMNKPAFKAILTYSPLKPAIVFVASRRQTRLTAMAFVSHLCTQDDPRQWIHMDSTELEEVVRSIRDEGLKLSLPFGIGMHHAGLAPAERALVEQLFTERKIQVLIATATLAWGINMPAHLVIIKGTEYYDGKTNKYIDFPVTDVLQMMGRAGRPQYDDSAFAVIYVQDKKKSFYKRFLYEPFPVESSLLPALANHVNAEINAGTITSRQGIMEYLAGTYLYRRLFVNPNFYGLEDVTPEALTSFLSSVVDNVIVDLLDSKCILIDLEENSVRSSPYGRLASVYYLDHMTIRFLTAKMTEKATIEDVLKILCDVPEYAEIPVRHCEDEINAKLAKQMRIRLNGADMGSPHTKAHLLLQAHFSRTELQADYRTDLRSVLDQCIRILQAMRELCSLRGWLTCGVSISILQQMIHAGRWWDDHPLLVLPNIRPHEAMQWDSRLTIPQLQSEWGLEKATGTQEFVKRHRDKVMAKTTLEQKEADELLESLCRLPCLSLSAFLPASSQDVIVNQTPVVLQRNSDVTLRLALRTHGPCRYQPEAVLPRWTKTKSAGWTCVLGEKRTDLLLACSSLPPVTGQSRATVHLHTPDKSGPIELSLLVMSDCYIGIDQEYTIMVVLK